MSKLVAARELVAAFQKWPEDAHKIYPSFRAARISLYGSFQPSAMPPVSTEVLQARLHAVQAIGNGANARKFVTRRTLLQPDGFSSYYETIQREANRQAKRIGFFSACRHTLFGWYKR